MGESAAPARIISQAMLPEQQAMIPEQQKLSPVEQQATPLPEPIHSEPQWASFPGRVLEGGYEVQELLEAEQGRAKYKIRVLGGGGVDAFVDVLREGDGAQRQLAVWEMLRTAEHPNLSTPLAAGQTQLDAAELIYVVLRKPDEMLDGILRDRALTTEEAGEVLMSAARALEHLHSRALVHGCVSPEQILAVGDSIQLSSECVRGEGNGPAFEVAKAKYVAPESTAENVTTAADVWCLGATLFEALTQKECGGEWRERVGSLPAPFGRIIERCLDANPESRCEVAEVLALFKGKQLPAQQPQRLGVPLPELARIPDVTPRPEVKPVVEAARVAEAEPAARARRVVPETARVHRDVPAFASTTPSHARSTTKTLPKNWIYAASALIVVLLVAWAAWPKHSPAPGETARNRTPGTAVPGGNPAANPGAKSGANPPRSRGAWETRTLAPDGSAAKTQPKALPARVETVPRRDVPPVKAEAATANGAVWRVVLYTYNRAEDAQKKAHSLNAKHHDLGAEVFSPDGHGAPYLVTAGGHMSRADALHLRQRVVRMGMPRDSYIQNYRQ